jgi:hypothetical protein
MVRSAPGDEMALRIPSMEASNPRPSWRFTITPNNKKSQTARGRKKKMLKKYERSHYVYENK